MIHNASPVVGEKEMQLIRKVINSGMLAHGAQVDEFEKRFAKLCGTKHAIAVNSGTAALHCATFATSITAGDEVITVPFTFVATANSIAMQGAKPVFVDVLPDTYNIDPSAVEKAVTPKTKAILAVNLYGQPADYNALREIAERHKLVIIEDAAQSVLAEFNGVRSGSLADDWRIGSSS